MWLMTPTRVTNVQLIRIRAARLVCVPRVLGSGRGRAGRRAGRPVAEIAYVSRSSRRKQSTSHMCPSGSLKWPE
jgi:hypothetical protein